MHRQVVNTGCGDDDSFLVGAAALYGQRKLGRRAATMSSLTEVIYIFFAVRCMRLLPSTALLSPPFAPARRAHPATGRPALSPLSPGAARRRGGHRALKAGAFEHLTAEHLRAMPAARLGQKNRRLRRAERDCGRPLRGAAGAIVCGFLTELGVLFIGAVRWSGRKLSKFFLLQKWIDLDELNPMVWVPSIVRRRIDFSLAVFKLRALRAVHPYEYQLYQ